MTLAEMFDAFGALSEVEQWQFAAWAAAKLSTHLEADDDAPTADPEQPR
jgi:hypothetical protein